MKKLLLFLFVTNFSLQAQVILTEDCESLTVGNVGTDFTGVTAGQSNWYTRTLAVANGNANYQVAAIGAPYGNVIKITGFNGANVTNPTVATTNSRFMYKDISSDWNFRDAGNDITEVEYDFFTGPATTSSNIMRVALYDGATNVATSKVLAGFIITMSNLTVRGLGHYDPVANGGTGTVGAFSFTLASNGATPPVFSDLTLQPSTWYKLGFSYNYTTGEMKFKGAGITVNTIPGAAAGTAVNNLTLIATTGGTAALPNAASAIGTFDNIIVKATSTDTLLATNSVAPLSNIFEISPNPASTSLTIVSKEIKITNIEMTDINGRIVRKIEFGNVDEIELNIADLSSGVYMLKITSDTGFSTKKIIKN